MYSIKRMHLLHTARLYVCTYKKNVFARRTAHVLCTCNIGFQNDIYFSLIKKNNVFLIIYFML